MNDRKSNANVTINEDGVLDIGGLTFEEAYNQLKDIFDIRNLKPEPAPDEWLKDNGPCYYWHDLNPGEIFRTAEECDIDYDKRVITHKLKEHAKQAWRDFNGSDGPDWSDGKQNKYYFYYSHARQSFEYMNAELCQDLSNIYWPTRLLLVSALDKFGEEMKVLVK